MVTAGVDVGAITAKATILEGERLLASAIIMAGYDRAAAARQVLDQALTQADLTREQVACLVATGYGRVQVPEEILDSLRAAGIEVRIAKTGEAVDEFNRLQSEYASIVAALHLTC